MNCPKCNHIIKDTAKFCENCGTKIEVDASIIECPSCHARIPKDSKFCPDCGSKIVASSNNSMKVIPCIYDEMEEFREGLAVVKKDDMYGCVDHNGDIVIPITYYWIKKFSDGVALACNRQNGTHFIDHASNICFKVDKNIKLQWSYFSEGLICAQNKEGKYGYIDRNGRIAIDFQYESASNFSEGLAGIKKFSWEKRSYIDKKGKVVIPHIGSCLGEFSEGLAYVANDETKNKRKWGVIDKAGRFLIPLSDKLMIQKDFSEGLTCAIHWEKLFVNKYGNTINSEVYHDAKSFSDGLACVQKDYNGKWGYIDKTGKLVIPYSFERASLFSCGFACVEQNGKYGVIDKMGNFVIPAIYDRAKHVTEYSVVVKQNGKWGAINLGEPQRSLNEVVKPFTISEYEKYRLCD